MASRALQFGEHFYNYVAPEEDPWCETVRASCSTDEIDVTNKEKTQHERGSWSPVLLASYDV